VRERERDEKDNEWTHTGENSLSKMAFSFVLVDFSKILFYSIKTAVLHFLTCWVLFVKAACFLCPFVHSALIILD